MKTLLLLIVFTLTSMVTAQTNDSDVEFIMNDLSQDVTNENYQIRDGGNWGFEGGGKNRKIIFKIVLNASGNRKATALLFQEIRGSTMKQEVFFIPVKGSSQAIIDKAFELISGVRDKEILRTISWAMMQFHSNNN